MSNPLARFLGASVALFGSLACHRPQGAVVPPLWSAAHLETAKSAIVGQISSTRRLHTVADARIRLLDSAGRAVDSTDTDANGAFLFAALAPGRYQVQARHIAHRGVATARNLRPGVIDTLRIQLEYDETGMVSDCVGPIQRDGTQGFGSQFCPP